jgi:large subunit ribosomal protein L6
MSRLAKKPIQIPNGVTFQKNGDLITAKGALGEITREFKARIIEVNIGEKEITLKDLENSNFSMALVGTYASNLKGMITGVTKGFEKILVIEGTGYRANVQGNKIVLSLGYSHEVPMDIPEGVKAVVEKDQVRLTGIDSIVLGQFAANMRKKRKPEPYKGKGVRYQGEFIDRKQGKKAVT